MSRLRSGTPSGSRHSRMKRLHDYLFPHERNQYRPRIFSPVSIGVFALGLLTLQVLYLAGGRIAVNESSFLASVLPAALTSYTNEDRTAQNLPALTHDAQLARAAQLAANDMAAKGYFAHESPDGKDPWYWLSQVGYSYSYSGQNLAVEFTDSKDVVDAWMKSPTHRANILKAQYTRIGIAVAKGEFNGKEATFVVQYFATPKTTAAAPAPRPEPVIAATQEPTTPATEPEPSDDPAPATTPTEPPASGGVAGTQSTITEPVAEPTPSTVAASVEPQPGVFGSEIAEAGVPISIATAADKPLSFMAKVMTSPHATFIFILTFLFSAGIVLLVVTIRSHMRAACVEAVGGGVAFAAIALLFLLGNVAVKPSVTLPQEMPGGSMIETVSYAR